MFDLIRRLFTGATGRSANRGDLRQTTTDNVTPDNPELDETLPAMALVPDEPLPFGCKTNWFAVKTSDGRAVAEALALRHVQPCNWKVGRDFIRKSDAGYVFVSPSCDGWTFAMGEALPYPVDADRNDHSGEHRRTGAKFRALLARLMGLSDQVQFFGSHRVSDYAGWAKAVDGEVVRVFSWFGGSGEVLANQGSQTPEEAMLGLIDPGDRPPSLAGDFLWECDPEADPSEDVSEEEAVAAARPLHAFPDESDVLRLAAAWSLDPEDLSGPPALGLIGRIPRG